MNAYAAGTTVSVDRSRLEVERLLRRYGAARVGAAWEPTAVRLDFELGGRVVRLVVPMPQEAEVTREHKNLSAAAVTRRLGQAERERWRTLCLLLKAKLESCRLGLTSLETEFLPHLVLDDDRTVAEHMHRALEAGQARLAVPALPAPSAPALPARRR